MEPDRELLPGTDASSLLRPSVRPRADEPVPMLLFLAGAGRAVVALVRFVLEVRRDDAPDPLHLEPRILRAA